MSFITSMQVRVAIPPKLVSKSACPTCRAVTIPVDGSISAAAPDEFINLKLSYENAGSSNIRLKIVAMVLIVDADRNIHFGEGEDYVVRADSLTAVSRRDEFSAGFNFKELPRVPLSRQCVRSDPC